MVTRICIDPGTEQSALCFAGYHGGIVRLETVRNHDMEMTLLAYGFTGSPSVVVESIENMGTPLGRSTIVTAMWIGSFAVARGEGIILMPRRRVKLELCGTSRAKDTHVRARAIELLGPPPTKKNPNPHYPRRPVRHEWSAIAIHLAYEQMLREGRDDLERWPGPRED